MSNTRFTIDQGITSVFTSPEIALSPEFKRDILDISAFKARLGLLAIDELHLVKQWASFPSQYTSLYALRIRIGLQVPCLGLTVSLAKNLLSEIRQSTGFNGDVTILRLDIDRPNICIGVDSLLYPQARMEDLYWLLPAEYTGPRYIPKTIVYFESISRLLKAVGHLTNRMLRLNYPVTALGLVKSYYSWLNEYDKNKAEIEFAKPSDECLGIRILCSTDAYGLGVNNPDVRWVIQWLVPNDPEAILQRMGRAMRKSSCGNGQYLMLCEPWVKTPSSNKTNDHSYMDLQKSSSLAQEISTQSSISASLSTKGKRGSDESAKKRQKLHPGVRAFIDADCYIPHILYSI